MDIYALSEKISFILNSILLHLVFAKAIFFSICIHSLLYNMNHILHKKEIKKVTIEIRERYVYSQRIASTV
jgi:hypothetical protein